MSVPTCPGWEDQAHLPRPAPLPDWNGPGTGHNRKVLTLKTSFSFWEPAGRSDSMKYSKNNTALKIRAIYYKSKWPLITRGNSFLKYETWLRKLSGVWANTFFFLHSKSGGRVPFRQVLGAAAQLQSTTLTAPLPSTVQQQNLSISSCINPCILAPRQASASVGKEEE